MKKVTKLFGLLALCSLLTFSCTTEDDPEPEDATKSVSGKWVITNVDINGTSVPSSDGSYLQFNECTDGTCTGIDYKGEDQTTGSFTYTQNEEESITIVDNDTDNGGSWNGEWTINSISDTEMVFSLSINFFGSTITSTYTASKQ